MLVNLQLWKLQPFIAVLAFFKGKGVRRHPSQRTESYTQIHLSFFLGICKSKSYACGRGSITQYFGTFDKLSDLCFFIISDMDIERGPIFLQIFDLLSSRNRDNVIALLDKPRNR